MEEAKFQADDTATSIPVDKPLRIFVTDADRRNTDITAMSDFMSNRISELTRQLTQSESPRVAIPTVPNLRPLQEAVKTTKPVVQDGTVYSIDFDSLPEKIREGLRKGTYHLGESRQVDGNLRPVIVDKNNVRVKDLTLKIQHPVEPKSAAVHQIDDQLVANLQAIAIQAQLRQMDEKLDQILDMQTYHIEFDRNSEMLAPFFDARDKVVHAQNEADPAKRRTYLDGAVDKIEHAMNVAYADIKTNSKQFLEKNEGWHLFSRDKGSAINLYISFIARDLQLLSKYISVLLQIFDYMDKMRDKADAFEKYRIFMLEFCTKPVGHKRLPLSLQIHNAFDASNAQDKNIWLSLTNESKAALTGQAEIHDVIVISGEDDCCEE